MQSHCEIACLSAKLTLVMDMSNLLRRANARKRRVKVALHLRRMRRPKTSILSSRLCAARLRVETPQRPARNV